MMEHFEEVIERVKQGDKPALIGRELGMGANTTKKICALARMRLGRSRLPMPIEDLRDFYEGDGLPVETIADFFGVSVSQIKDMVRAFGLSRDAGAAYRAGFVATWNAGETKATNKTLAGMSVRRQGPGNPRFGLAPWNKGETSDSHPSVLRAAKAITGLSPSPETRERMSAAKRGRRGAQANRWNGGHKIGGYVSGSGKSYAHRDIAEWILGRPLLSVEHVHHVDRDRTNNDPANLLVIDRIGHARLHGALYRNGDLDQRAWLANNNIPFQEL